MARRALDHGQGGRRGRGRDRGDRRPRLPVLPGLRPDPTPDEGSATFSKPTFEQPVTYGQYLDRVEIPRDTSTEEELQRPGALVSVQVTIKGYRGQALPLRWYLLDGAEIVDQQSRRHP